MKHSAALSLWLAGLVIAKSVNNVYQPLVRRQAGEGYATNDVYTNEVVDANNELGVNNNNNNNNNNNADANNKVAATGLTEALLAQKLDGQQSLLKPIVMIWARLGPDPAKTTINDQLIMTETRAAAGAGATDAPARVEASMTQVQGATPTDAAAMTVHTVTVGGPGGLAFAPDQVKAAVGDMVVFNFLSQNHTVSQSAFDDPCKRLEGGIDSGYVPNPNNTIVPAPQVAMQVMVKEPLWFYCRQNGHCGKGMTFSINPTAEKTQAQFQSLAIAKNGTGAGSAITGNAPAGGAVPPPVASPAVGAAPAPNPSSPVASPAVGAAPALNSSFPVASGAPALASTALALPAVTPTGPAGALTTGTGTLQADGTCMCAVMCAPGKFPDAKQGIAAFGGMPGGLPANMTERVVLRG